MEFLISLGAGFVVGLMYWLVRVRSPAPPLIALAGLLGMVMGEQAMPVVEAHFLAANGFLQVRVSLISGQSSAAEHLKQ